MLSRQKIILYSLLLFASLIAAWLTVPSDDKKQAEIKTFDVYIAKKTIEKGTFLNPSDFQTHKWPINLPLTHYVKKIEEIRNKKTHFPLFKNMVLTHDIFNTFSEKQKKSKIYMTLPIYDEFVKNTSYISLFVYIKRKNLSSSQLSSFHYLYPP